MINKTKLNRSYQAKTVISVNPRKQKLKTETDRMLSGFGNLKINTFFEIKTIFCDMIVCGCV